MKREIAEANFKSGYSCAQAVALAFKEEFGLDKSLIAKLCSGFGGGMGRMREVCGAVSGMIFVVSAKFGYSDVNDMAAKAELYQTVQRLMGEFKNKNSSYICRELLGIGGTSSPTPETRTEDYYRKRPCVALIGDAAEILENYFNEREKCLK